jgi:hypothetical protein
MELFSFAFLLFLGVKFLMAKSVQVRVPLGRASDKIEVKLEAKLQPHSAFMIGFVRVLGNLGVLVVWVLLAANFISHEWVPADWPGKLSCVGGAALGTAVWYASLSWIVSLGHGKFSEATLLRMERLSGVGLLALALSHGCYIMYQLAKHKV